MDSNANINDATTRSWNDPQRTAPSPRQRTLAVLYLGTPVLVLAWAYAHGHAQFFETRTLLGLGLLAVLGLDTFFQSYASVN
jgi:hypothetical protein